MQQSENPEVSMSLSINTCYFSSSGYSLGLSPGWKWHWGACSTYFMTWKHKMCGPSPTTSGFLVDPSSLLGKRPLCPWSWLQGLGGFIQQPAFVQRREQRAEGTFSVKLPVGGLPSLCRLPGFEPRWMVYLDWDTRKQYPKWERKRWLLIWSRGGWWELPKGTGRHIFTQCMSMVIRDACAHV